MLFFTSDEKYTVGKEGNVYDELAQRHNPVGKEGNVYEKAAQGQNLVR